MFGAADWPHAALFGAFLAMAGFGAMLAFVLRDRTYAWYAAAALAHGGFALARSPGSALHGLPFAHTAIEVVAIVAVSGFLLTFFAADVQPPHARRIVVALAAIDVTARLANDVVGGPFAAISLGEIGRYAYFLGALYLGVGVVRMGAASSLAWLVGIIGGGLGIGISDLSLRGTLPPSADAVGMAILASASILLAASIGERMRATERNAVRMEQLAHVDGLTGIPNRMALDERLDIEWERGRRSGTPLAALMVDVDHFKSYNDTYGHKAGDDVLRAIARAISSGAARRSDFVARYGGEEFVVLLPATDLQGAVDSAERIRLRVADLDVPHEGAAHDHVTISLGAASLVPRDGETAAGLIARADAAMYLAKETGRNRVAADGIATESAPVAAAPAAEAATNAG